MAGSTAKKKGKRGWRAPRIADSSDSDSDVALLQALSTPDSSRQQEDKRPKYPEKKKKSSPVSSVKPGSDGINAPAETQLEDDGNLEVLVHVDISRSLGHQQHVSVVPRSRRDTESQLVEVR
ncbi:hypothetical protein GQ600_7321 [Phytophthora cactorum]|nr:hypothetical protein GQ600_7321 [Phytophthora cactorum]